MKKFYLLSFLLISLLTTSNILADLVKGKWSFVKDKDYCYIGSLPTFLDIPKGKKRGESYILVYRINKNPDAIVQINSGYPYKEKEPVNVKIDKKNYEFYSEDDSAWTNNDKEIIYAMKKGVDLSVTGISKRGTKTTDTYTLNGFTAAYNQLSKDC
tara:strand:+ start:182 stop:649 length:468 start_codon:yes stop_codon:yes gene_type:complete